MQRDAFWQGFFSIFTPGVTLTILLICAVWAISWGWHYKNTSVWAKK